MKYFFGLVHTNSNSALHTTIKQLKRIAKWQDYEFTPAITSSFFTAGYLGIPKRTQAAGDPNNIITSTLNTTLDKNEAIARYLNAFHGDFRLASLNTKQDSVVLAVSAFNPQTLFYAAMPDCAGAFIVSDNIALISALVPPKVDLTSIALWLSGRPDPNRSMFSNIQQVSQASFVVMSKSGGLHSQRFWDIDPDRSANNTPEEELQDELKHIIRQSISRSTINCSSRITSNSNSSILNLNSSNSNPEISAPYPNSINSGCAPGVVTNIEASTQNHPTVFTQLSGGMDSTTVSVLALQLSQQLGHESNFELHTVSHTYHNTESCDESLNIEAMLRRHNFTKSHFIELEKYTDMSFTDLYPTHFQNPGMVMSPKYLEEAELLKSYGAQVLLTGNGGDEMFWGHSLTYYDRLRKGDVRVIPEFVKAAKALKLPLSSSFRSVFLRPFLHYDIMPFLGLASRVSSLQKGVGKPPWLTDMATTLIHQADTRTNPFADRHAELAKFARYDGMFNTSTFNSMRSYQAVFDEFDLKVAHPLFTKALAEFSFAVPQKMHLSGKYPKLLLRKTMTKELPEQVCWNEQKTVFDQHFAKLVKQNSTSLRLLLQNTALADLGLVDNTRILNAFDNVVNQAVPSINVDLLYVILLQSWYQTHIEQ